MMYAAQKNKSKKLSVVLLDETLRDKIFTNGNHKVFTTLKSKKLADQKNIIVVSKASRLSELAGFIREMNEKNYLKGLFIRPDVKAELIPKLMVESGVSTLKQTLIIQNAAVLHRVLHAWKKQAREMLIADAAVSDNILYVISCSFRLYNVRFEDLPALRRISASNRGNFVIDEDGSYLHWPQEDIHLDIDMLEYHTDKVYRKEADLKRLRYHRQTGLILKKIREETGLRQSDIEGLSARQVRRIENGEAPLTVKAQEKIAAALDLEMDQLLNRISRKE